MVSVANTEVVAYKVYDTPERCNDYESKNTPDSERLCLLTSFIARALHNEVAEHIPHEYEERDSHEEVHERGTDESDEC